MEERKRPQIRIKKGKKREINKKKEVEKKREKDPLYIREETSRVTLYQKNKEKSCP